MKPYYERSDLTLHLGDCLEVMASLPENSIDTCITDPPYELGFMGKKWDASGVAFQNGTWVEVLRVLKPGATLMAFGGTRTHHRLMCAIEDAGFEIRDCLFWVYGSGFPKSLSISKAIDKAAGTRKVVGTVEYRSAFNSSGTHQAFAGVTHSAEMEVTEAGSDAARTWDGYGTALKPAFEPIVLAMKPLDGTFAENAQKWGVAGLAIDAGRIGLEGIEQHRTPAKSGLGRNGIYGASTVDELTEGRDLIRYTSKGRWPANLLLDEEAAVMLDEQSGERKAGGKVNGTEPSHTGRNGIYGTFGRVENNPHGDTGGASRFFYVAKASRAERDAGLEGMPEQQRDEGRKEGNPGGDNPRNRGLSRRSNHHPTVKPVALMEYLCKLTRTPTGGIVLDPFMGSGTTGIGAIKTGRPFVGIERDAQYIEIAYNRLNGIQSGMLL